MDELIIRHLQGDATAEEERELLEWRRAAAENERRYVEVERLWRVLGHAAPRRADHPAPRAREILGSSGSSRNREDEARHASRREWWVRGAAAAALVVVGLGLGRVLERDPADATFGATEFVTGSSELVTARLADGSVVRLAPRSRLRVSTAAGGREVWLDGRAFFAVAPDAERPFRVRTRAGETKVLGTRFEVEIARDSLRVLVVEGGVSVTAAAGERVEIGAGEMSRVVSGEAPSVERVEDVHAALQWMGSFIVFESTPLREVAREIEQRYGIPVLVPDSALAERTVTAWFSEQPAEEVLMVICRIVDAHCSTTDSGLSIEP